MNIKNFEELIIEEFDKIILRIIKDYPELNISAKARAGAEVSDFLEEKFVEYSGKNKFFKNSEKSPKGATKNPWDAKTIFCYKDIQEIIWIGCYLCHGKNILNYVQAWQKQKKFWKTNIMD